MAAIVLDKRNRVSLQKRADLGLWGIPSGHVEPGETVVEAIVRKVKEETNLAVRVRKLVGVYSDPGSQVFKYPDGRAVHFITLCFLAEVVGGDLRCNSPESVDVRFFPLDGLPSDLLPMHPRWLEDALENQEAAYIR